MTAWKRVKDELPKHQSRVYICRLTVNDPIPAGDRFALDDSYYTDYEYIKGFGRVQDGEELFTDVLYWRYVDVDELEKLIESDKLFNN